MNEEIKQEKPPCLDRNTFLAEIERLYVEGHKTRDIARLLGENGNKVGRNLREIKRRWTRAAHRQQSALSLTQCAAVCREAMSGWQRSQKPKLTTTVYRDAGGSPVKSTVRRQEGPGDKTFLLAAVSALRTLRQFTADEASKTTKDGKPSDAHYVALLNVLRPEQVNMLDGNQLPEFRAALNRLRAQFRSMRRQIEGRKDGPDDSTAEDEAGAPGEAAPQDAAGPTTSCGAGGSPASDSRDGCTTISETPRGEDPGHSGGESPSAICQEAAEFAQASAPSVVIQAIGDLPMPVGNALRGVPSTAERHGGRSLQLPSIAKHRTGTGMSGNSHEAPPDEGAAQRPSDGGAASAPDRGAAGADVQPALNLDAKPKTDGPLPATTIMAQAAPAAPVPTPTAPGREVQPYPPIPLLNNKPPTPEVHRAYQQWQDHLLQSLLPRPLYGSALPRQPPQAGG